MIRYDLRQENQIRPLGCELGIVSEAAGSARFSTGSTSVLARVYGPSSPKYLRHENFEKASIEIELSLPSSSSNTYLISGSSSLSATTKEKGMMQFLLSILEQAIQTELFPRLLILFQIDVIHDDGSLLSTTLNACILAALDSGIPMRITPVAVTLGLLKPSAALAYYDGESTSVVSGMTSTLCIDPCYEEEQGARSDAQFVLTFTSSSVINSDTDTVTMTDNSSNSSNTSIRHTILRSQCVGMFEPTQLVEAMRLGAGAADTVKLFFRELLLEKHS